MSDDPVDELAERRAARARAQQQNEAFEVRAAADGCSLTFTLDEADEDC